MNLCSVSTPQMEKSKIRKPYITRTYVKTLILNGV